MRWIFGKMCPIFGEIFSGEAEFMLIWTGGVDAMVVSGGHAGSSMVFLIILSAG